MAEPRKDDNLVDSFNDDEARDTEQEHVRSPNDSEEQERAKLRLVVEVAEEVWG